MKILNIDTGAGIIKKKVEEGYDPDQDPDYVNALKSGKRVQKPYFDGAKERGYSSIEDILAAKGELKADFVPPKTTTDDNTQIISVTEKQQPSADGGFSAVVIAIFKIAAYVNFFLCIILGFIQAGLIGGAIGLLIGSITSGLAFTVLDIRDRLIQLEQSNSS